VFDGISQSLIIVTSPGAGVTFTKASTPKHPRYLHHDMRCATIRGRAAPPCAARPHAPLRRARARPRARVVRPVACPDGLDAGWPHGPKSHCTVSDTEKEQSRKYRRTVRPHADAALALDPPFVFWMRFRMQPALAGEARASGKCARCTAANPWSVCRCLTLGRGRFTGARRGTAGTSWG
jgi:hypothetical protein